ncbi:MAG: rhodanese-like domain-containing protein [Bacillota bacterium]|jgi:rhodanese-related sulfurtransferase
MRLAISLTLAVLTVLAPFAASSCRAEHDRVVVEAVDKCLSSLPSDWFQMKPEVLYEKLDGGEEWFVLDVRRPEEFATGHLQGAVNIPVHELGKKINFLPQEMERQIVVYCGSGVRSMFAASALLILGYECVYNMRGGFSAWEAAGLPVEH